VKKVLGASVRRRARTGGSGFPSVVVKGTRLDAALAIPRITVRRKVLIDGDDAREDPALVIIRR
jgi:hypothetical protein